MSTELSNGVIIPEEYSDDWYDEMSINLRKLNDVITAASDNATDIQRLDTDKANSSDLATVATSGSYTDLTDKPTINDSTITIQKNGSTVDTFTTNGSAKTINIPVPTKTSDLTNDSNFVDTSNPAVSSGITSAKVTDYDTHIADTDIHVTTADKNRWNNNTYVFRYSSTALTASSTNSNTLLDNTDNLKVGDKVIDSSGVLFSVTAIDTANSTFTIGTALVDLAVDANVMHLSGNETASGAKTFVNGITMNDWLYFTNALVTKGTIPQSSVTPYRIYFGSGTNYRDSLFNIDTSVSSTGVQTLTFRSAENVVNGGDTRLRIIYDPTLTQPRCVKFQSDCLPNSNNTYECGNNNLKWKSFNGLNPSSLGMHDKSNGIDISGYLTNLNKSLNTYTPPVNGWIEIELGRSALPKISMRCRQTDGLIYSTETSEFSSWGISFPVIGGKGVSIYLYADSLNKAGFYPCQGNV